MEGLNLDGVGNVVAELTRSGLVPALMLVVAAWTAWVWFDHLLVTKVSGGGDRPRHALRPEPPGVVWLPPGTSEEQLRAARDAWTGELGQRRPVHIVLGPLSRPEPEPAPPSDERAGPVPRKCAMCGAPLPGDECEFCGSVYGSGAARRNPPKPRPVKHEPRCTTVWR